MWGVASPHLGVFLMVNAIEVQAKKEPLNVIDQDNLNNFFGQNGIANTLDQNVSELLRFNELNQPKSLTSDPTYGLLELHANDSFLAMAVAGQNIQSIDSYRSICDDLVGEAQKSRMSLSELCESPISSRSVIKELKNELESISSDNAFKNIFDDFRDKYSHFKQDLSEINQYILGKLSDSSEEHSLDIKSACESLNKSFSDDFKKNFDGLYVSVKNNDAEKSFQSDFKEHTKALTDALKNASIVQEKSHQNTKDNSIENTF